MCVTEQRAGGSKQAGRGQQAERETGREREVEVEVERERERRSADGWCCSCRAVGCGVSE